MEILQLVQYFELIWLVELHFSNKSDVPFLVNFLIFV